MKTCTMTMTSTYLFVHDDGRGGKRLVESRHFECKRYTRVQRNNAQLNALQLQGRQPVS